MVKKSNISLALIFIILAFTNHALSFECSDKNAVDTVIQKINSAFKKVHDYSCDVEIVYYKDGAEDQRYRLKVYFKREKNCGLNFAIPIRA
jgi:outer membrane lipoprotein-sorting protein